MTDRVFHPADAAASNDRERALLEAVEDCDTHAMKAATASYVGPSDGYRMTMKFVFDVYSKRCADEVDCRTRLLEHAFQMFFILCAAMAKQEGRRAVYRAITAKAEDDDESVSDLVRKACGAPTARALHRWLRSWW